jgi:hypothetical protein
MRAQPFIHRNLLSYTGERSPYTGDMSPKGGSSFKFAWTDFPKKNEGADFINKISPKRYCQDLQAKKAKG